MAWWADAAEAAMDEASSIPRSAVRSILVVSGPVDSCLMLMGTWSVPVSELMLFMTEPFTLSAD